MKAQSEFVKKDIFDYEWSQEKISGNKNWVKKALRVTKNAYLSLITHISSNFYKWHFVIRRQELEFKSVTPDVQTDMKDEISI